MVVRIRDMDKAKVQFFHRPLMKNALVNIFGVFLIVVVFGGAACVIFWPRTTEGKVTNIRYWGSGSSINSSVEFEDGRWLRLYGQPNVSIKIGRTYRMTYNGVDYLYGVEEIE